MLTKNIRALKNFRIKTGPSEKSFTVGEKERINFTSKDQYDSFLSLGNFEEVRLPIPSVRPMTPVIGTVPAPPVAQKVDLVVEAVSKDPVEPSTLSTPEEDPTFRCPKCNRKFSSKRGLSMHMKRAHPDLPMGMRIEEKTNIIDKTSYIAKMCPECDSEMKVVGEENTKKGHIVHYKCPICSHIEKQVS